MAEQHVRIGNWTGGLSDDEKVAVNAGSFSFGSALDFRHDISLLKTLRKTTKESGSTVDTEVHDAARVNGGDIYLAGTTKLYKRAAGSNGAAGTYSVASSDATIDGIRDLDYRADLDTLYLIDETDIHTWSPVSSSPAFAAAQYGPYEILRIDNSGNTSTIPSAISETSTTYISQTLNNDPLYSVQLEISNKGTGNWTITVHDALNRVVGSVTVANASVSTGFYEFVFSSPLRLTLGQTYHFHVTTSNATGTIVSTSANTISTGSIVLKAGRLIDTGDYGHYAMQFGNKTLICNERYIAEVEYNATFDSHRLVFPADAVSTGMTIYNQYVVITAARRNSSDTLSENLGSGYIFLWDGYSVFFEMALEVPFGIPWAPIANESILQFVANGRIYQWAGGDFTPVYEFHGVDEFEAASGKPTIDAYLKAPRHGSTGRDSLTLFGFPHTSANPNVKVGVYSYGSIKMQMPRAIGFDYVISTGNDEVQFDTTTTPDTPVTGITMVKNFGSNLLIAWKDYSGGTTSYGIDYVNDASDFATAASYESLWVDADKPDKTKLSRAVQLTFRPLPEGVTITPKIKYEREGSWITGTAAVEGDTEAVFTVDPTRFREAKVGFDITSEDGNRPEIISLTFKIDDLAEEEVDTEHAK